MSPDRYPWPGTGGGTDDTGVDALLGWGSWGVSARVAAARPEPPAGQSPCAGAGSPSAPHPPPPACLMATRVLTMSARLGPVQQPEEPVFAQLKPVLGAREAAIFPGDDLKQQQPPPPPPQQQQQHPGGGGGGGGSGGATLPAEEMVQVGGGHLLTAHWPSLLSRGGIAPAGSDLGEAGGGRAGLGGAGLRGEGSGP